MTSNPFNATLLVALSAVSSLFAQAPITLAIVDPPGVGFNDPRQLRRWAAIRE